MKWSWKTIPAKFKVSKKQITKKLVEEFYDWRGPLSENTTPKPLVNLVLPHIIRGKTLLDFGCGLGNESKFFSDKGLTVTGVDLSGKQIDICKKKVPNGQFVKGDITTINLNRKFDFVWCHDVLEHLFPSEVEKTVKNCVYHVAKRGFLFLVWDSPKYRRGGKELLEGHSIVYPNGYQPLDEVVEPSFVIQYILENNRMQVFDVGEKLDRVYVVAKRG